MKAEAIESVGVLVGLELWGINQAADTVTLQFGRRRVISVARSGEREVGDYALHIQCPHAFVAGGAEVSDARELLRTSAPMMVTSVDDRPDGQVLIEFSGGRSLRIRASDVATDEQWRLLVPGSQVQHLVFGAGRYYGE